MLSGKEYIFIKSSSHCILLHPSNMLHSGPSIILQSTTFMILCKGQPLVLSRPQEPECNFTLLHADINFMGFFTLLACSRSCTWPVWWNYHSEQNFVKFNWLSCKHSFQCLHPNWQSQWFKSPQVGNFPLQPLVFQYFPESEMLCIPDILLHFSTKIKSYSTEMNIFPLKCKYFALSMKFLHMK